MIVFVFRTRLCPLFVSKKSLPRFFFGPPAIFFWAACKHLKPNVKKTVAEKRTRVGKVQTLGMRAGSHSEPLGLLHPCPFFGHHFFRFWFQISVFGEKKYGHRPKKNMVAASKKQWERDLARSPSSRQPNFDRGPLGASGAWWWGVPGGTPRRLQGGFSWSPHLESLGDLYLEGPTGVQSCAKWVQQRLCTGGLHDLST